MTIKSGRAIQVYVSYLCFILSGIVIFNPLFKSENIGLSFLTSALISYLVFETIIFSYKKEGRTELTSSFFSKVFTVLTTILSIVCTIIYLTEIIKDISHIAGRGISLLYYSTLAFAILAVSYYLCYNTEKGIFRFSILSISTFIFFVITIAISFATTKKIFWHNEFPINTRCFAAGLLAGLFLVADTPIFISTFKKYLSDEDGNLCTGILRTSFLSGIILFLFLSLLPYLILGKQAILKISDPLFSCTKLFPQVDMTETGSVIKIVGFMIKSSVYIFFSSSKITSTFKPKKVGKVITILCLYLSIPTIFLTISLLDKSLEYGAFQHMIYASSICLGICSWICYFLCKNQK